MVWRVTSIILPGPMEIFLKAIAIIFTDFWEHSCYKYFITIFYLTYVKLFGCLIIDVEIHWHHRDLIMISPVRKENFGIGGFARYEVSSFTVFHHYSNLNLKLFRRVAKFCLLVR